MTSTQRWIFRGISFIYGIAMYLYSPYYSFMLLNGFLAYLPIEWAFQISSQQKKPYFYSFSALWLLFYPNVPYLLTDFFHLNLLPAYTNSLSGFSTNRFVWLHFALLTIGILSYCLLGTWTALSVIDAWIKRWHLPIPLSQHLGQLILSLLSSLAIYIGRFDRLHSVDLILRPITTLKTILGQWSGDKVAFILSLTLIQLVLLYLLRLISNQSPDWKED